MNGNPRVRFAPSPTGPLHIGGVRTALYNYLFAKKYGGDFVLRIEDTDQTRFVEGTEEYIIKSLNWLNIPFDEGPGKEKDFGPYRQSERKHLYKDYAEKLVEKGWAYYAFDTAISLDNHRKDHETQGKTFIYNWHNRLKLDNSLSLTEEETRQRITSGEAYVIRFKMPENEQVMMRDIIRGAIEVDTGTLDDKVLFKSDGMPTYHLANIVDDYLMKITHVIRGEEWLPSLPLHVMLYRAFDWDTPKFAHLPLILKPTGKGKLSKRDGEKGGFPVYPLEWSDKKTGEQFLGYRETGYFPEAVTNMLVFLGWNPGTAQEIFSLEELIDAFELEKVHKSGAKFNPEKTKWFQHHYFQEKSENELAESFLKILEKKDVKTTMDYVKEVVFTLKERATFVSDFWELGSFYFITPTEYEEKALKKVMKSETAEILHKLMEVLGSIEEFTPENLQNQIKNWISDEGIGFGKVMQPLRLAMVGALQGPDLFHIIGMVGKEETQKRIRKLIDAINL
ncbi:MAG TPA: glutamate--tRNA ligase [Flavobacteriaceae bacterium]|nr:glutamate--tRNA ligase [Flavobacteriaceae bacterium]